MSNAYIRHAERLSDTLRTATYRNFDITFAYDEEHDRWLMSIDDFDASGHDIPVKCGRYRDPHREDAETKLEALFAEE